jgi:hypothetical protein
VGSSFKSPKWGQERLNLKNGVPSNTLANKLESV